MAKIQLDNVESTTNVSVINTNFQKLADELQEKVMYRDNPVGEPNALENDVDMNGHSLYNVNTIKVLDDIVINNQSVFQYGMQLIDDAIQAAGNSEVFAETAETKAAEAAASAIEAANTVQEVEDELQGILDRLDREVYPQDFSHLVTGTGETEDWKAAIDAAWLFGATNKIKVKMSGRVFPVFGQLNTYSNLHVEFDNGAFILPKSWPVTGAILTNVHPTDSLLSVQSNIRITNPQLDGQYLPYDGLGNANALGFASGASSVRITDGLIKNFEFSWSGGGAGGKAVNFEQGVNDAICSGTEAENCGIGFFVQGRDGVNKQTTRILFSNLTTRNCDAAFAALGMNSDSDPDGDPSDMLVIVDGLTFYNCGHAPSRPIGSDFQKSAPIVLGEGMNVRIDNVKGYNDVAYTSVWPAGGAGVVGEGLTGDIGAVIWGWGRNIHISNIEYHGNCDSLIRINRARAIGDDASPTAKPQNVFRFDVESLRHYGTAQTVLALDSNAAARVDNADLTGRLKNIITDVLSVGIMDSTLAGYTGVYCEIVDQATSKIIRGTASNIRSSMNTFASTRGQEQIVNSTFYSTFVDTERLRGGSYTLADDAAMSITPASDCGVLLISSSTSLLRAIVSYRANGTGAQCVNMGNAVSNFAVTTGTLSGTTGTDNNFTVSSHTDGKLYFENRRGGSVPFSITLIG